jgi:multimeric flavodoxin WrbA
MKVVLINGSQKVGKSNSGAILDKLDNLLKAKHEVEIHGSGINLFSDETFKRIISGDVIILIFPLFVYSIPSHTLKMLIELENTIKREQASNLIMYAIVNCGFFEGIQNNVAFEIIENWCKRSGVKFGGGIGLGGGEMFGQTKDIPYNKKMYRSFEQALLEMEKKMEFKGVFETKYLSPHFPQFLFRLIGTTSLNSKARKNGLTKKDMRRRM